MADISFNIACKELKISQIVHLSQLFQLLHLVHIYGHGAYELSRMLMRKNVNNDVSKLKILLYALAFEAWDHTRLGEEKGRGCLDAPAILPR